MITLTLRTAITGALEFDGILPERLAALGGPAIAALPLWLAGRELQVGDL